MLLNLDYLSPRDAYAAYIRGGQLIDIRENEENKPHQTGLKNMVTLPLSELESRVGELPKHKQVILLSGKGIRSSEAARYLADNGFANVAAVEGGIVAWAAEGLPVA